MIALRCPSCNLELSPEQLNRDYAPCGNCHRSIQLAIFPAQFKDHSRGNEAEAILTGDEASCFFHDAKKAVVSCERCGRFLCRLCDILLGEEHICSTCIETGRKKGKIKTLENQRTLYDRMAITAALLPIVTVFGTLVFAPYALYLAIRHRNTPGSLVRHGKWRFYLAGMLATLQIIGWILFFLDYSGVMKMDF
ncbi:MAG: hypothetical protein ACPGVU_01060 [Limisphaerales bacterium]